MAIGVSTTIGGSVVVMSAVVDAITITVGVVVADDVGSKLSWLVAHEGLSSPLAPSCAAQAIM